jgi:hypothetical protein
VRDFIKSWGDSGTVDLMAALGDMTILTASRCLHGDDVRETLHNEVAHLYHDLDQGITPISFFLPYAPIPAHARRNGELLDNNTSAVRWYTVVCCCVMCLLERHEEAHMSLLWLSVQRSSAVYFVRTIYC